MSSKSSHGHIASLDALRGVAAVAVLLHHIGVFANEYGSGNLLHGWFSHGYLAVDFFFVLSGFVISKVYEPRLRDALGVRSYMIIRLRRLYPVIAVGAVLGLAGAALRGVQINLGMAFAAQALFIPFVVSQSSMFALNVVQWSLAFELLINAVHAAILRYLTTARLMVLVGISFIALAAASAHYGSLGLGWAVANVNGGFARVVFGFFAGVLVQRVLPRFVMPQVSITWIGAGIMAMLAFPIPERAGWVYDLGVVALFPLLVALSVHAAIPSRLMGICIIMGRLSYPLYALHEPILLLMANGLSAHAIHGVGFLLAMLAATGMAVVLSVVVQRLVDLKLHRQSERRRQIRALKRHLFGVLARASARYCIKCTATNDYPKIIIITKNTVLMGLFLL